MQITGYDWDLNNFNNVLDNTLNDFEFFNPAYEAELQAEYDETMLWGF